MSTKKQETMCVVDLVKTVSADLRLTLDNPVEPTKVNLIEAEISKIGASSVIVARTVTALVVALTDFPVTYRSTGKKASPRFKPFQALVPTSPNSNSHDYPMGQVCVTVNKQNALRANGTLGNAMGPNFRIATDEEIEEFFKLSKVREYYGLI